MEWHVYIMTNKTRSVLYIGMTDNILERVKEHKLKRFPDSFTAKYHCYDLVYFEQYADGHLALKREGQLKK